MIQTIIISLFQRIAEFKRKFTLDDTCIEDEPEKTYSIKSDAQW